MRWRYNMYGINAAAFLAFVSVLFLSVRLCRHSVPARMKVLHILCAVLGGLFGACIGFLLLCRHDILRRGAVCRF